MWTETPVFREDLERICGAQYIPWDDLRGRTILITGATGLIGSTVTSALLYVNRQMGLDLTVLALVRDSAKAENAFGAQLKSGADLQLVYGSVEDLPDIPEKIDYVVHGASQTASRAFVEHPVETIRTAILGTGNLLELARSKQVLGMVYLSSMEVYGYPPKGHKVNEQDIGVLSPIIVRNSYPISKQQCESLCCSYTSEYDVPAKIIRLTQTFGPGVFHNDHRVFGEFARCAIEKEDIVLKTQGETERDYLYTADAASAILTVLLKGVAGDAYNAANEGTYCSISEMAQIVAESAGIKVRFDLRDTLRMGYADTLYMDLDTTALRSLGWKPTVDLPEMYRRMIMAM